MRKLASLAAVIASVALTACGENVAAPPTPDAAAYEGASEVTSLDASTLADEASDPDAFRELIDDAGFAGAVERTWLLDRDAAIRRVAVRAHRFDSEEGAEGYLDWVAEHPEDLIGAAEPGTLTGDVRFFVHVPGGCCPNKDVSSVLGAWADGDVVWTVVVAGPSATVEVADGIRANMEEGGASAPPSPYRYP